MFLKKFLRQTQNQMPKGKVLSLELREIISRHHIQQHQTAEQIYADIFDYDPNRISIQYLRKLCRSLHHQNFLSAYLCGGMKQTGRPLQQNYFHRALIREYICPTSTCVSALCIIAHTAR